MDSLKVLISGINCQFNNQVFVDHFWFDDIWIIHFMDSYSRFFAAKHATNKASELIDLDFENLWIGQLCAPGSVQRHFDLKRNEFSSLLDHYNINVRPVTPNRHDQNNLEPKHGVICSIFAGLLSAAPEDSMKLLSVSSVLIFKKMHGTEKLSAFEIFKGYLKQIDNSIFPQGTTVELFTARD